MLIEEIIRSCRSESVAQAAVASIGPRFARDVAAAAEARGMSVGGFTALSVDRFASLGDEGEMRAVLAAMDEAQEPVLAGLHRILSIRLTNGIDVRRPVRPDRTYKRAEQRVERCA